MIVIRGLGSESNKDKSICRFFSAGRWKICYATLVKYNITEARVKNKHMFGILKNEDPLL
jgi:hypothetical protein